MALPALEWHTSARKMRLAGASIKQIMEALGRPESTVYQAVRGYDPPKTNGPVRGFIPVPKWAANAGLSEDYRDMFVYQDEFAAAAHCRALKREMGAGL